MKISLTMAPWLACVLLAWVPAGACAYITGAESIEWVLADSDLVVVGRITSVKTVPGSDKLEYPAATVSVTSTLKGEPADSVTFVLRNHDDDGASDALLDQKYPRQWMDEGIPLLFFLVKNDGKRVPFPAAEFAWVLREESGVNSAVMLGASRHKSTGCIRVYTRDYQILSEKEAILDHVKEAVRSQEKDPPHPHDSFKLFTPGDSPVSIKLHAGSAVFLMVPIDERLEAIGRTWCKPDSDVNKREDGAEILRHFKNETNIQLLKSLLNDPGEGEEWGYGPVAGKTERQQLYHKKVYFVRQAAYDALREFGVNVDKPVLEVLLEGSGDKSASPATRP